MAKKKSDVAAVAARMKKERETLNVTVIGGELVFKVKLVATIKERVELIANVLSIVCAGDVYRPYLKTAVSWYYILKTYTDLPLSNILTEKDGEVLLNDEALDEVLCLIEDDDVRTSIVQTIGNDYVDICKELDEAIEDRRKALDRDASPAGKIVSAIEGILDALDINLADLKSLDVGKLTGFMEKLSHVDNKQVVDYVVEHQGELEGVKQ